MHTRLVQRCRQDDDALSTPRATDRYRWFEVHDTHYRISADMHGVPRRFVRVEARSNGLSIVGENILAPSDDFDGWLEAGAARFSSHIGLPADADLNSVATMQVGEVLIVTVDRKRES